MTGVLATLTYIQQWDEHKLHVIIRSVQLKMNLL